MKLVELKNISKKYHTNTNEILALKDVSFDINEGDIIAIVGPSGCGKSTILSILCGLEEKSSGSIIKDDNLKFGYMFQKDTLFDWITIFDNCLLGAKINHCVNDETLKRCEVLLKSYGLYEFKDSYPNELSGGEKRIVTLAAIMIKEPNILLLDEPINGLDPEGIKELRDLLKKLAKKEKMGILISSHNLSELETFCTDVVIIKSGEIISSSSVPLLFVRIEFIYGMIPSVYILPYHIYPGSRIHICICQTGFRLCMDSDLHELLCHKLV